MNQRHVAVVIGLILALATLAGVVTADHETAACENAKFQEDLPNDETATENAKEGVTKALTRAGCLHESVQTGAD
jgi:hypothetical protein